MRPAPLTDTLRAYLRAELERGITQDEIARVLRAPQPVVSRFASGERGMRLDRIDKLAAHLGLELRPVRRQRARRASR